MHHFPLGWRVLETRGFFKVIYAIFRGLTHALWLMMQLFQAEKHNLLTFSPQSLILFLWLTPLHQSSSLSFCCDPCWCCWAKFSSCLYSRHTIFSTPTSVWLCYLGATCDPVGNSRGNSPLVSKCVTTQTTKRVVLLQPAVKQRGGYVCGLCLCLLC